MGFIHLMSLVVRKLLVRVRRTKLLTQNVALLPDEFGMFYGVKHGEGVGKLSCRENDVGRSPEKFGRKSAVKN